MMRSRMRPSVTACKWSQMARTWIPPTKTVLGSRTGHAWHTNSCSLRLAFSVCNSSRVGLGRSQDGFKLLDLFVCEFAVVDFMLIFLMDQSQRVRFGRKPPASFLNGPRFPFSHGIPKQIRGLFGATQSDECLVEGLLELLTELGFADGIARLAGLPFRGRVAGHTGPILGNSHHNSVAFLLESPNAVNLQNSDFW